MARGSAPSGRNREGSSTDARFADGPSRSSEEGPVIGLEQRGRLSRKFVCGQPAMCREESSERAKVSQQAVCDPKADGDGSVQEGQSEQGWSGSGRVQHRGVRSRSAEQAVCDVESDVLGVVLSASGQTCGDPEGAW